MPTQASDERAHGRNDLGFALVKLRSEDVLAVRIPPNVVPAVAPRVVRGEEIHPVLRLPAADAIAPPSDPRADQLYPPLQARQVDRFALLCHVPFSFSSHIHRLGPATCRSTKMVPVHHPKVSLQAWTGLGVIAS